MIELTCWGCGREGRVPGRLAGRRVRCKGCRTENRVPDRITDEVYVADLLEAVGPEGAAQPSGVGPRGAA